MDWIQFITLFATMLAGFGFIYREIKSETATLKTDINAQAERTDKQATRTDRLYEMFIDLLKEKK